MLEGRGRSAERLSRRQERDRLAARFARWFGRQEPSDLSRSLQARHADHPLLVRGEPGTGRGLLIRYVHAFSAGRPGRIWRRHTGEYRSAENKGLTLSATANKRISYSPGPMENADTLTSIGSGSR